MRTRGRRGLFKLSFLNQTLFPPPVFFPLPTSPNCSFSLSPEHRLCSFTDSFICLFSIGTTGSAKHGDGRENGIAAGWERGCGREGEGRQFLPELQKS